MKLQQPSVILALNGFILAIGSILYGTAVLKLPAILPLIMANIVACLIGKYLGYSWNELQQAMFEAIGRVLPAVFLLIAVGMLIGVWILSGTIPAMMYWGLTLLSPGIFLATTFILCVIASTMTGTSFGTMGTIGIALLGVGVTLGYPAPLIAGAIVSGAYFGDKMSPVSSSTYIAASLCEVELFSHIGSMLWTTLPAAGLATLLYGLIDSRYAGLAVTSDILLILESLARTYHLTVWTLLPPLILMGLAYRKYPAIPSVLAGVLVGAGVAWLGQQQSLTAITDVMVNGYAAKTGIRQLDVLLSRGGIQSMSSSILLLLTAISFGGILEKTQVLAVLTSRITAWADTTGRLVMAVLLAGYIMMLGTGSQMVSIILPGRAFMPVFLERKLARRVLSRTIEDSGVLAAPLVPWSVHAFYILGILGVSAYEYAPYALMCWLVPLFSLLLAYTGIAIWREDEQPIVNKK